MAEIGLRNSSTEQGSSLREGISLTSETSDLCFTYYTHLIYLKRGSNLPPECRKDCNGLENKCPFYEPMGVISEPKENSFK
jgi:hypothetical protein